MAVVNPIDSSIVLWLNHFAGWSGTLDSFAYIVSDNPLAQAVVPVTVLWFLWFRKAAPPVARRSRELIVATLLAAAVGLILARSLALVLPFRTRPMVTPGQGYHLIHPAWSKGLHDWSSFPSDHAVLFFALAAGITLISRRIGIVMLLYAAVVDGLPRIYLGYHYPSDIVAGALLGSLLVCLAARRRFRVPLARRVLEWSDTHPGLFYAAMFAGSFEIASMFDSALQLAKMSADLVASLVRHAAAPTAASVWGWTANLTMLIALSIGAWALAVRSRRGSRLGHYAHAAGLASLRTEWPAASERPSVPLDLAREPDAERRQGWWRPELLEFTHDAIIIWEMEGAGIVYWNAAAEELYGYSREEAYGKVTHSLLRTRLGCGGGSGADLEPTLARFGIWVGELIHTTRAGERVAVEGRLALMSQRNGRWLVLEVNRSVTDAKKAQAARQSAERQLANLRQAMPD